ncbi:unnamed protein product [Ambrosiozyma monospora]|uniref:Unnamed protein product n=1 Tax=Ambrosiozyma monospora TaxID=43982 RepID=A0A9W6YXA0_AMBMO|nr:unnamed protein product [Ambrosiozyma monospora]
MLKSLSGRTKSGKAEFVYDSYGFSKHRKMIAKNKLHTKITTPMTLCAPLVVILDRILSFLTWTNENQYHNFLFVAIYITVVSSWNGPTRFFVIPMLSAISFCCFYWFIHTIYLDSNCQNKQKSADNKETDLPLEEIFDRFDNMTTRFAFFVSRFPKLGEEDLQKLIRSMFIGSPVYFFILKYTFNTRLFLLVGGVLLLTWNSTWMIATVHLIWRSRYVRIAAMFITGLEFSLVDMLIDPQNPNSPSSSLYTIVPIRKVEGQIEYKVTFQVLENQRKFYLLGWKSPFDRSHYTTLDFEFCCADINDFPFPNLVPVNSQSKSDWEWLDSEWKICEDEASGKDGWTYYNNKWHNGSNEDSALTYTRSRKLTRTARVFITDDAYSEL